MKKRIISVLIAFCMMLGSTVHYAYAEEERAKREYYRLEVLHTDHQVERGRADVDFMLQTPENSDTERVYIKAEDFSRVLGGDYSYEYNQTYTECAYVSPSTKHVVRYMLNSSKVSVVYVGDSVSYTAPYDILYEDGVTWLPFEFSVELFHLQAVPEKDTIHIISYGYNPVSVANLIHNEARSLAFDWIDEVGETMGTYGWQMGSAAFVACFDKILSFDPTEWGALLAANVTTYYFDAGYAEIVGKAFIYPSKQELTGVDTYNLKALTGTADTYKNIAKLEADVGLLTQYMNDAQRFTEKMTETFPFLCKMKGVKNLNKALKENKNSFCNAANEILAKVGKQMGDYGGSCVKIIECFLVFVDVMENYMVFLNKNDRTVASLQLYVENSKYEEKNVLQRFAKNDNEFLYACRETAIEVGTDAANRFLTKKALGAIGVQLEIMGFAWDMVKGGPLKTAMDAVESRMVSRYAIQYQYDSQRMYYDYRNKCLVSGGANEESLDDMVNALYAYLKFSYIGRSAAAATFDGKSELLSGNRKINAQHMSEKLNTKNEKLAEYLACLEGDVFTPSDARSFKWNDAPYTEAIRENGTPVECPTQNTVPVFEFPDFPDADNDTYVSKEEAVELVKKVIKKYTGGLLSGLIDEAYSYEVIDGYVDGDTKAYVVMLSVYEKPDALFFVSVYGTEVWTGIGNADGGYTVYTQLDLLNGGYSDMLGAIGDLGGQLMEEIAKEQQ